MVSILRLISCYDGRYSQWSDATRWRNSIGLGLWIVAKDTVSVWHEWMSQRELNSRQLRSRPFNDVDPAQLDLLKGEP